MKSFHNKVAAITGAGSGMGRSLAIALAKRGCHLALSDINLKNVEETAVLARAFAVNITTAQVDMAKQEQVYQWAKQSAQQHGRVNMIFNNAGVALAAPLENIRQEDFEWVMAINFWGVIWGTQAFLPYLKASGDGHIINTSSLFGLMAAPFNGAYNASKFAVRGYTEALRMELDLHRIPVGVTCVHPGGVRTNIVRSARVSAELEAFTNQNMQKAMAQFENWFMTNSDQAARIILKAVAHNKRRVLVGADAWFLDKLVRLVGTRYQGLTTYLTQHLLKRSG